MIVRVYMSDDYMMMSMLLTTMIALLQMLTTTALRRVMMLSCAVPVPAGSPPASRIPIHKHLIRKRLGNPARVAAITEKHSSLLAQRNLPDRIRRAPESDPPPAPTLTGQVRNVDG